MSQHSKARVVVLAPAVSLVRQHCAAFAATGAFRSAIGDPRADPGVWVCCWCNSVFKQIKGEARALT